MPYTDSAMKILKAFRYLLKLTPAQRELLYRMAGCGRVVYNDSLELLLSIARKELSFTGAKKELYQLLNAMSPKERIALAKKFPSSAALNKHLTQWKKLPEREYLNEAYRDNLDQRQRDLRDKAVKDWCSGKRSFPKFRTRKLAHHSTIRFVNFTKYCSLQGRHIKLPNGLGLVRYYKSQDIEGLPKNCTVSLDPCGNWHVAIQCEIEVEAPVHNASSAVGLDMGIAKNMTLSNGNVFSGVHSFKTHQEKLAKEQRKLSRKERGSENWKKQKLKVAKLHRRIADIRRDYQQKSTTEISENHAMVVVEDLKVANMSASAKGSIEQPGTNVKAKSGLNRSILDQGWHEIHRQLKYKMAWRGGIFLKVPPHGSSQTCPACLHKDPENRKTQAEFICVHCGFEENADVVGAINTLNCGLAELESPASEFLSGPDVARRACEVNPVRGQQQEPASPSDGPSIL